MFRKAAFTFGLLFSCSVTFAQLTTAQLAELHKISREYTLNKNEYFILADLLKDGLLKLGAPYTINYNRTELVVNGKVLPEPFYTQYNDKITEHFKRLGIPMEYRILSFKGDKLSMAILYVNNYRRNMPSNTTFEPQKYIPVSCPGESDKALLYAFEKQHFNGMKEDSLLISTLVSDGVIKKAGVLHIRYNNREVWVNNTSVSANAEKYIALAKKVNNGIIHNDNEYYGINYDAYEVTRFGFCGKQ